MAGCLELNESNCKNCYKCIRSCPVKSIRFSDGQAHIVEDECILCGHCHVVCPNDAKKIRNDVKRVKAAMKAGKKVMASLAPSFVANYNGIGFDAMRAAIMELGFADVEETAIGATVVKKEYEKIVAEGKQSVIISTCCHSVNTLIQKYYPMAIGCMAKVKTPMHAHCELLKAENPGCYTVFIGPCISKKAEAETVAKDAVDCVLTYEELSEWMAEEKIVLADFEDGRFQGKARLFPVSGGILRTMELDEEKFTYMAVDGTDACINALKDIEENKLTNCFIEMSACHGSCVNGPVMERNSLVSANNRINRFAGKQDFPVDERNVLDKSKIFNFEGGRKSMPSNVEIEAILKQMGKTSPEQELNCGCCGYNTCREKAVAVYQKKAEISMCLPYLMEKAESFSDTIIKNTPNGIIVLNESLEIQLINSAARQILNVRNAADVLDSPVVRVLDPVDYVNVLTNEQDVFEKKKYLAEYKRYVEETIIYDKKYHIIISIMKDVTERESVNSSIDSQRKQAIEITDRVVEKQMRVVQEIASLLGETTAETKIALTKLKESLLDE